jgi:Bacterial SH3 domain
LTYTHCPSCGQKALAVATRCPRCGAAFEPRLSRHPEKVSMGRRVPLGPIAVVAVGLVLWIVATRYQRPAVTPNPSPARPTGPAPAAKARPAGEPVKGAAESARTTPTSPKRALVESLPPVPGRARPPESAGTTRRYATTWVNVHSGRSSTAPVIKVLRPRQMVLVSTPEEGWYRVSADQGTSGFVDARYLDTTPPPGPP